jgi:hypothetical protein
MRAKNWEMSGGQRRDQREAGVLDRALPIQCRALQALGINPVEAQQRGYPLKEQSAISAEAKKDVQVGRRS